MYFRKGLTVVGNYHDITTKKGDRCDKLYFRL